MGLICRIVIWILVLLWLAALALLLIGTLGLFGQEQDPLSGVFLVLLGMPWIYLVDLLPQAAWPWATALAPGLNILVILTLCRLFHARRG